MKAINTLREAIIQGWTQGPKNEIAEAWRQCWEAKREYPYGLSFQQARIMNSISLDGIPDKMIANMLHCSEHSINSHLRRIFQKMGVKTRAQAAFKWGQMSPKRVTGAEVDVR